MLRTSLCLLFLLLPLGCSATMPRYKAQELWPQKDVVVLSVFVEERLAVEEYLLIVKRELAKLPAVGPQGDPLYEVRVDFYLSDHEQRPDQPSRKARLARVSVAPGEEAARPSMVLY